MKDFDDDDDVVDEFPTVMKKGEYLFDELSVLTQNRIIKQYRWAMEDSHQPYTAESLCAMAKENSYTKDGSIVRKITLNPDGTPFRL